MLNELLQSTERCQETSCNNWYMSMPDLFCLKLNFSRFILSNLGIIQFGLEVRPWSFILDSFCRLIENKFKFYSLLHNKIPPPFPSPPLQFVPTETHTASQCVFKFLLLYFLCQLLYFLNFGTFVGMQIALLLHPSSIVGIMHGWNIYLCDVIKYCGDLRHLHCYKEITWCYISNVPIAGISRYVISKKYPAGI